MPAGLIYGTDDEWQVKKALTNFRTVLEYCSYRDWTHRILVWRGDPVAIVAESMLLEVTASAHAVCNQSSRHRQWARIVSANDPDDWPLRPAILKLIDTDTSQL